MRKKLRHIKTYIVISMLFLFGVAILMIPEELFTKLEVLPKTGEEDQLSVSMSVDKAHVQRDSPLPGEQELNYQIRVSNDDACERKPLDVVLLYDASGSMRESLRPAKKGGIVLVRSLDFSMDQVGVISYNDSVHLLSRLSRSRLDTEEAINSIRYGDLTNFGDALDVARRELLNGRSRDSVSKVIVVISDGRPNKPNASESVDYAIDKADRAKNDGIRIISVALGEEPVTETILMSIISSPGIGNFFYFPSLLNIEEDMSTVFSSISKDISNSSLDTRVYVDLNKYKGLLGVKSISNGGIYSDGILSWDVGEVQCQETQYMTFSLVVNSCVEDLEAINLFAEMINSSQSFVVSEMVSTVIHSPLFNLSITDGKEFAQVGERLAYNIYVENVGTGNAYGVVFKNDLPGGNLILWPRSISEGGEFDGSENYILWDNGGSGYILDGTYNPTGSPDGNSMNFFFEGVVPTELSVGSQEIINSFSAVATSGYQELTRDVTYVHNGCNLSVEKMSSPDQFIAWEDEILFTIKVENLEGLTAESVEIVDTFDSELLEVISADNAEIGEGTLHWMLGDMEPEVSQELTYILRVRDNLQRENEDLLNEVSVSSATYDIDSSNNYDTSEILVTSDPFLSIKVSTQNQENDGNSNVPISVTIQNKSMSDARDVSVQAEISQEFDYVFGSSIIDGGEISDPDRIRDLDWGLDSLKSGRSVDLSFSIKPNNFANEETYLIPIQLAWKREDGKSIGSVSADVVVNLKLMQNGESLSPESEGSLHDTQPVLFFSSLVQTKQNFVYSKVILGLLFILPLPLYLSRKQLKGFFLKFRGKASKKRIK